MENSNLTNPWLKSYGVNVRKAMPCPGLVLGEVIDQMNKFSIVNIGLCDLVAQLLVKSV